MPGFDKTGPLGSGPATGRGFGPCGGGLRRCFGRFGLTRRPFRFDGRASLAEYRKALEEELGLVKKEEEDLKTEK